MDLDGLLDERERLLGQRAAILSAMGPPVLASDLDEAAQGDLRASVEQALDDAFFGLFDPLDCEIADHEAASAWLSRRADIIDIRSRQ